MRKKLLLMLCVLIAIAGSIVGIFNIIKMHERTSQRTASSMPEDTRISSKNLTATSSPTPKPTAEDITKEAITTEKADLKPNPLENGHIVAIDPGHQAKGNSTPEPIGPGSSETKAKVASGTTGRTTGVPEYQLTLDVSLKLRDELQNRGYQVVMIRESHDVNISNAERAEIANTSGAEIFLRIHANGSDDTSIKGALTMAPSASNPYVSSIAPSCQQLSQNVVDSYCSSTGFKNLGVQNYDNMSGINWCKIPVTIVEMGFMSNPDDDTAMQDQNMQYRMASGIADGVDMYFGI
ncbi:N-acetylmuramoyl-L-alanine amidase family protein [Novisyntrophococcus fermenticellae]|uniref:N-acetylmuramoyl-L-alanine amidase family protein n=1 Tax=Novisyntrophococcus fermenticellae TaxID=2068655 RepID=UPI001E39E601|nr:N-acetylmuramoyl-L-alanine amidase [Novisyntrophococcus fermenticellae]